jgi:hypothetical protein
LASEQLAKLRCDHIDPVVRNGRFALLQPEIADAKVNEVGEAAHLHSLLGAIAIAAIYDQEAVSPARINLYEFDLPGDPGQAEHLGTTGFVEGADGPVANLGEVSGARTREHQVCRS